MSLLAWNCRGSGGNLGSPKMGHLSCLAVSTKAQVLFISETRKQSVNKANLLNKFCFDDACVVPTVGLLGGLWLLWKGDFSLDVVQASDNLILANAVYRPYALNFSLICVYGDPHHVRTDAIWHAIFNFVVNNPDVPVLCMGDMNNIMNANEKLGPNPVNARRVSNFCHWIKQCSLFDLGFSGPAYTWSNKRFASTPTFERLDRCLANAEWCSIFPSTTVFHLPMMYSDHVPILIML